MTTTPLPENALPPAGRSWRQFPFGPLLLAAFLLIYALLLFAHVTPAIAGPDDNGYFAQATLIAQTGHTWFRPQSDAQFIGMHWLLTPDGRYISRYPPGLPVIVAAIDLLFGWKASLYTNPLLALATLAGLYLLIRQVFQTADRADFSPTLWALAGVILLAVNPEFVNHALSGDSHIAVACFLVWGLWLLMRWADRPAIWRASVAGLVLGVIPTVRYADAIVVLGILFFMLSRWPKLSKPWLHYLAAFAGALVPLMPLLVRNQLILGGFWRTGYALTGEQYGFGWNYFTQNALPYMQGITSNGIGLLFALGWVGMVAMLVARPRAADGPERRVLGLTLALMTLPMLLVYMAYYWGGNGGGSMRFLVPTFGLYIVAGLWLVRECAAATPLAGKVALAGALVLAQSMWGITALNNHVARTDFQKESLARVTLELEKLAKPGDLVISSNAVGQQLDFVRQWKVVDQNVYLTGGGPGPGGEGGFNADGSNVAAQPMQLAKVAEQREKYSGTKAERERKFLADVKTWAGDHNVWLIAPEETVVLYNGPGALVTVKATVTLPDPPENLAMGPGGGPGGGPGQGGGQARGGRAGRGGRGVNGPANPPNGSQNGGFVQGPQGPPNGANGSFQQGPQDNFIRGPQGNFVQGPQGPPNGPGPNGRGGQGRGGGGGMMGELNGVTALTIAQWELSR